MTPENINRVFGYKGFNIPVHLIEKTGAGPESFGIISEIHFQNAIRYLKVEPCHHVLELGCGIGRDAIPLTEYLTTGSYIGVDIIRESIEWCDAAITSRFPRFRFYSFDVADRLHNPAGTLDPLLVRLPADNESIDRIIVQSVFTHMVTPTVRHYLREFARLLKPDGLVYATCFLVNDRVLESARRTNLTPYQLRFEHEVSNGCFVNNLEEPLGAVAFTTGALWRLAEQSGLTINMLFTGAWSGYYPNAVDGQDVALLGKAGKPAL
jgi:SAM-dependent methyltransferase